jgi:hypothetical protein
VSCNPKPKSKGEFTQTEASPFIPTAWVKARVSKSEERLKQSEAGRWVLNAINVFQSSKNKVILCAVKE